MTNVSEHEEKKICPDHGEYISKVACFGETQMSSKCPECSRIRDEKLKAEKERSDKQARLQKIEDLFRGATIPKRFAEKTFDGYMVSGEGDKYALAVCKKYADNFDSRLVAGGGLVLCGMPGTGKTHLAAAIANHAIKEFCRSVVFSSVMAAMRRVKSTYSRDSEEKEIEAVRVYTEPDLLILDEVGVQFGSDAEKMILFEIINNRYQDMKPTILISNLSIDDLKEYIGERVIDRMHEGGGAVIAFDWDSYRSKL